MIVIPIIPVIPGISIYNRWHWWLDNHVKDGKKELNFDEYSNRRPRFQYHKMEEIIELVKEGRNAS